jgi:pyridinium-3,5-biscarboxylic acid mononucleotide sulfurtransferase
MIDKIRDNALPTELSQKERRLREIVQEAADTPNGRHLVVGFSGGVDSSLLLWESVRSVGPERVIAVTATSPTSVREGEEQARRFASALQVRHLIVPSKECSDPAFLSNPPNRCYLCKRIRYSRIASLAESLGPIVVLDGSQADDDPAERPGMRALEELGIRAPLAEAGINKQDVRALLKAAGFTDLAEQRAEPCLATRIPTGDPITEQALETVRRGEQVLRACGMAFVRLRHHGAWARIVTDRVGMVWIANRPDVRQQVVSALKELGFRHVTLDLEEYGSQS